MNNPIFHSGLILIQWPWWWTFGDFAVDIEVPIVARADVFLEVEMPGDPAAQVGADIRENLDLALVFAQNEAAMADDGFLPTIDFGTREVEGGRRSKRVILQRP